MSEKELVGFAADLSNRAIQGVLIVDNCSPATHKLLAAEIGRPDSQIKLITIDYVLTRMGHLDSPLIQLLPRYFEDVVRDLLKQAYPDLKQADIERIAQFAPRFSTDCRAASKSPQAW